MTATVVDATSHVIGPVEGVDYHVAPALYPEDSTVARWNLSRWDTPAATWAGNAPRLDVSCDVISVSLGVGRDLPLDRFRPGAATVLLDDPHGIYSPWKTAGGDVYGAIRPGIDVVVWIVIDGVVYPRFVGIVDSIEDAFPDPGTGAHRVTFTAHDYLSLLAAYDGVELPAVGAGDLAGARLDRIATNAQYVGARAFDVGTVTLQATTLAKNALDEMGMVTDTETGALFADRDGTLVFRDRNGLVSDPHYPDVQATFGEVEPEICYTAIALATDLAKTRNIVSIANTGGTAVTLSDLDSVSLYRPRTFQRFDLIHEDPAESTRIAQRQLDFYAYAANCAETLDVDMTILSPEQRSDVLDLDLLYRIQVRRRAEGVQIVADLQIEAISETVDGATWTISFSTFSAAAIFKVGRWDRDVWDQGLWGY